MVLVLSGRTPHPGSILAGHGDSDRGRHSSPEREVLLQRGAVDLVEFIK